MERPKVIFLDAVGTLFGVKGSVGEIYGKIAHEAGVNVSVEKLNEAFKQSLKTAKPPVFPGATKYEIPELEFQWWEAIARSTFGGIGVLDLFSDFNVFFTQLYSYFATAKPWYVYPDVIPTLKHWRELGIELGIISNFDTRIYTVMEHLEITHYFSSITICSTVGAAKPDSKIFTIALRKHNCRAEQAWHIGDSLKEDYYGAKAAGLYPFLIER
ncbi:MAG: HAD family hydrolase [Gomphosphaeria aponina SAG 52.96 = DSM 107014]|uniref:HAD family hydrolase n=1 Tax=Gomphosphaeria aponina SAG 52.96 = DSM 107014 TaxID=1521640 RepID=A0A941JNX2_9CHRO|nr:HAD family hydrolase [Gomphosphaeria aponina SAG 52.96 = DSM 107014]